MVLSRVGETGGLPETPEYWAALGANGKAQRWLSQGPKGGPDALSEAKGARGLAGSRALGSEIGSRAEAGQGGTAGGGVPGWRGARNTQCRKRHVTVTPQKQSGLLVLRLAREIHTP